MSSGGKDSRWQAARLRNVNKVTPLGSRSDAAGAYVKVRITRAYKRMDESKNPPEATMQSREASTSLHRGQDTGPNRDADGARVMTKMARALYTFLRRHQPSAGLSSVLSLSMINLVLVLAISALLPHARCHPVDWLRKFTPSSRDDGSSWLWGWVWAADGTVSIVDRSPPVTFPARPASFGAELSDPLLGYVIPLSSFAAPCPRDPHNRTLPDHPFEANPIFGCPELCVTGPHEPGDADTWIALVQRGGCPFVEKARQAQKLGAKAVVVGGDRDTPDALLNMFSERTYHAATPLPRVNPHYFPEDASDVKIAATFIKYWDYIQLSSMIASSNTTHNGLKTLSLLINTEYSAWEWYSCVPFTHFSMQESQPIRTLDLSSPLLLSSFCLPVSPSSPS